MTGDLEGILSQAQRWRKELDALKARLRGRTVEVGRPPAVLRLNGLQEVLGLELDLQVLARESPERVERVLAGLINEGLRRARAEARQELSSMTGGLPLAGLLDGLL